MSYSIDPLNPSNNPENTLTDNVRMVLDTNYVDNVPASMTENSWEILNVANMNTFVFPEGYKNDDTLFNAKEERGSECWCPEKIDIAIVFQTIEEANLREGEIKSKTPSFLKEKDYRSEDDTENPGISNRPCGFLTSRETLMPMMIIPTKNYIQNGLVHLSEKFSDNPNKTYSVVTNDYGTCFNWVIETQVEDETNPFEEMKYYGSKCITQEDFSFINLSNSSNPKEYQKISTRYYLLEDEVEDFYYKLPEEKVCDDVVQESLIYGTNGGAFAFSYNFHGAKTGGDENKKPNLLLHVSNNVVNIPQVGNIEVTIEKNKSTGSITTSKNSQKMGQLSESTFSNGTMIIFYPVWNGIALSGGIDDMTRVKDNKGTINVTIDSGFIANKTKDVEMSDFSYPNIKVYNTSKPKPMIVKEMSSDKKQSVAMTYDPILQLRTINCFSSFAYTPVFFQKSLKFSLYIKDNSGKNISTQMDAVLQNSTRQHFLYPICYLNNTDYSVPEEVEGKKIILKNEDSENTEEENVYYRFDFDFTSKAGLFQRRGIEIFGFFHRVTVENKTREMENTNGRIELNKSEFGFSEMFNKNYDNYNKIFEKESNTSWIDFATDMNVNRSPEQSGGTITLDKYAMIGQFEKPPQPVGEVRLKAIGGNKMVYRNNEDVYFTGIGIGISYQDTSQADTMTLNLSGIEKKLQEVKLAGSPFFDGDPIETVMDYLSEYANFQYEFDNDFNEYTYDELGVLSKSSVTPNVYPNWMKNEKAPCPRSVEFKRPAINFLLGTTVYEAIKQVCEKTNKTFFITKEGIVRIVDQNIYGVPVNIAYSISKKKPSLKLNSNQILNISLQPYVENVYNQVVTASLKGKRKGTNFPTLLNTDDMMPNVLYKKIENGNIKFPWSRMIVKNEMAILSPEEAEKVHAVNCNQFTFATFTGGITIPGNSDLEIFDTVSIDDSDEIFYITNINHSYNSSSRVWNTSLQVTHIDKTFSTLELTIFPDNPNKREDD